MLAMILIIALYIYLFSVGNDTLILGILYGLVLPGIVITCGLLAAVLGIVSIYQKGSRRIIGIVGLLCSLISFISCCLFIAFVFIASGGGMGL